MHFAWQACKIYILLPSTTRAISNASTSSCCNNSSYESQSVRAFGSWVLGPHQVGLRQGDHADVNPKDGTHAKTPKHNLYLSESSFPSIVVDELFIHHIMCSSGCNSIL